MNLLMKRHLLLDEWINVVNCPLESDLNDISGSGNNLVLQGGTEAYTTYLSQACAFGFALYKCLLL